MAKSEALTACWPSLPLMPTPTCAAWIMLTSLAPSPMARHSGFGLTLCRTRRTSSAFCDGLTRQAMTLRQRVAMLSKIFSRRLWPMMKERASPVTTTASESLCRRTFVAPEGRMVLVRDLISGSYAGTSPPPPPEAGADSCLRELRVDSSCSDWLELMETWEPLEPSPDRWRTSCAVSSLVTPPSRLLRDCLALPLLPLLLLSLPRLLRVEDRLPVVLLLLRPEEARDSSGVESELTSLRTRERGSSVSGAKVRDRLFSCRTTRASSGESICRASEEHRG